MSPTGEERLADDRRFDLIDQRLMRQEDAIREMYRAMAKMAEQVVQSAENAQALHTLKTTVDSLVVSVRELNGSVITLDQQMVIMQLVRAIVFTAVIGAAVASVGLVWFAVTKPYKHAEPAQVTSEPK